MQEPMQQKSKSEWSFWKDKLRKFEEIKAALCFQPKDF